MSVTTKREYTTTVWCDRFGCMNHVIGFPRESTGMSVSDARHTATIKGWVKEEGRMIDVCFECKNLKLSRCR